MILHTFLLIFTAEMADKTQLMIMALTNKYKLREVIIGMICGVLMISALSVLAGDFIGTYIPMYIVKLCAAAIFLIFGIINLKPSKAEDSHAFNFRIPILAIAFTFLLAELGDKTQLATVAFAADHMEAHLPIFLGASLGLIAANLIGIFAGKFIFSHFDEDMVKVAASFIFFGFGSLNIFEVFPANTVIIWIYSTVLMTLAYITYTRSRRLQ